MCFLAQKKFHPSSEAPVTDAQILDLAQQAAKLHPRTCMQVRHVAQW